MNWKIAIETVLQLICEFSKCSAYKFNIKNQLYFHILVIKEMETEMKNTIKYNIKEMKYQFGNDGSSDTENLKILLREMEK